MPLLTVICPLTPTLNADVPLFCRSINKLLLDPVVTLTFNFTPVKTVVDEFHVCVKLSTGIELVTVFPVITNDGLTALKTRDGDSFITAPVSNNICPAAPPTVGVLPTVILLIPPPPPPLAVVKTQWPLS